MKGMKNRSLTISETLTNTAKNLTRGEKKNTIGPLFEEISLKDLDLNAEPPESEDERTDSDREIEPTKNRRCLPVEDFKYKQFEDENVTSNKYGHDGDTNDSREDKDRDEFEEEDESRHAELSLGITELPVEDERRKNDVVITEAYPVSEYDPTRDFLGGEVRMGLGFSAKVTDNGGTLLEPNKARRRIGYGRRKIEIERLEDKAKRTVTFSKRREGVFRKMKDLCTMCGTTGAIITFSEADNPYPIGYPSVDAVVEQYLAETSGTIKCDRGLAKEIKGKCVEAMAWLEAEKKLGEVVDKALAVVQGQRIEALSSEELEQIEAMLDEMVPKTTPQSSITDFKTL